MSEDKVKKITKEQQVQLDRPAKVLKGPIIPGPRRVRKDPLPSVVAKVKKSKKVEAEGADIAQSGAQRSDSAESDTDASPIG